MMNISAFICGILIVLMAALSIILLIGKGSFLIAGYNISSPEVKARYHEKRLCRVVGGGLLVITVFFAVSEWYRFELPELSSFLIPWGLFGTIAVVMVLANTICKKRPE